MRTRRISKAIIASVRPLEKQLSSLQNENRQLEKFNGKLTRRYGEQKTVVRRAVRRLVKCTTIRLVGMRMCISRTHPRWRLRAKSKLDYFSESLGCIRTGRPKRSFGSANDVCDEEHEVLMTQFSMEEADSTSIYLRLKVLF